VIKVKRKKAAAGHIWRAAGYARLSRDDGDEGESNSITSQKGIIADFADGRADMDLVASFEDDGWSGSNFERPGFARMMAAVDAGEVDCIVVKDLSRFGRNYLEVGNYLERVFPAKGVRLVAIADGYDGAEELDYADSLLVPVRNLINDNYCAATSAKVRANLEAKRRRGEYLSSFAPYGYVKDPEDRHRLVPDPEAAPVVRSIFRMRLEGFAAADIAAKLNGLGVKSPHELKRTRGCRQHEALRRREVCLWHAREIIRILSNEVYVGNLVQGRTYRPSFRSKVVLPRPEDEWARVEGTHEPIVDRRTFDLVADLMVRDTRRAPGAESVRLLAGLAFCADCGESMTRHTVKSAGKVYGYYRCSANHRDKSACSPHSIRDERLEAAVRQAVSGLVRAAGDMRAAWEAGAAARVAEEGGAVLAAQERALEAEVLRCRSMRKRLYDDMARGVIGEDELADFSESYERRAGEHERQLASVRAEIAELESSVVDGSWIDAIARWADAGAVTRAMVVELVERVDVSEGGGIDISFRCQDRLDAIAVTLEGGAPWDAS